MTTATLTLSGFLLARLAEDEAVARAAAERDPAPWTPGRSAGGDFESDEGLFNATSRERTLQAWGGRAECTITEYDPVFTFDSGFGGAAFAWPESVAHIARHDPARVLAEVDAKRRIVNLHSSADPCYAWEGGGVEPCDTLRLLALPYASHPDCREEWLS